MMENPKPSINLMLDQIGLDLKGRKLATTHKKTPENTLPFTNRQLNEHDPDFQEHNNNNSKDSNISDYMPARVSKGSHPNLL